MPWPEDETGVTPAERERLASVLALVDDDDRARVEPPAALWDRIASVVEADAYDQVGPTVGPVSDPPAPVVRLDARRRRRHRAVLAVAAAVVAVVATGVVLALTRDADDPATQVVAATALEPLEPVGGATAAARLVREGDQLRLVLDTEGMAAPPAGQHYEVWLLDPEHAAAEPISLGSMSGDAEVAVPDGVDPAEYDVVDISLQDEGQVEHSGHSLLRGALA